MLHSSLRSAAGALGLLVPFSGVCVSGVCVSGVWAQNELLVSGFNSNAVHRYDAVSGAILGTIGPIVEPQGIAFGADGLMYIVSEGATRVLRYDAVTLAFVDEFIADDPATPIDETGGLVHPTGIAFGPDGGVYVASFDTDAVHRYDGATGAFTGIFVTGGSGGLDGPDAGIAFGPDGHLYVPSFWNHRVLRYDGATGAFLSTFVAAGATTLNHPRTLRFRPDGQLLVSSEGTGQILRFAPSGVSLGVFATPHGGVTGFEIAEFDHDVYSTSSVGNNVFQWDGATGVRIRRVVAPSAGGLSGAVFLALRPDRRAVLSRIAPGVAGVVNQIDVRGLTPSAPFALLFGGSGASVPFPACGPTFYGIAQPELYPALADAAGAFHVQAFDGSCRFSNLVVQTLR